MGVATGEDAYFDGVGEDPAFEKLGDSAGGVVDEDPVLLADDGTPGGIPDDAPDLDVDEPMFPAGFPPGRLPTPLPDDSRAFATDWFGRTETPLDPVVNLSLVAVSDPGVPGGMGPAASRWRGCIAPDLFTRTIPSVATYEPPRLDPVFVRLLRSIRFGAEKITSSRFER